MNVCVRVVRVGEEEVIVLQGLYPRMLETSNAGSQNRKYHRRSTMEPNMTERVRLPDKEYGMTKSCSQTTVGCYMGIPHA